MYLALYVEEKDVKYAKGEGWIELLGCGMVHPNVLENCGIDSKFIQDLHLDLV